MDLEVHGQCFEQVLPAGDEDETAAAPGMDVGLFFAKAARGAGDER